MTAQADKPGNFGLRIIQPWRGEMAYGRRKALAKYATRALNATYRIKIRMSPFQGSFMRNAEIPRASPWAVSSGSVGATQEIRPNSSFGDY